MTAMRIGAAATATAAVRTAAATAVTAATAAGWVTHSRHWPYWRLTLAMWTCFAVSPCPCRCAFGGVIETLAECATRAGREGQWGRVRLLGCRCVHFAVCVGCAPLPSECVPAVRARCVCLSWLASWGDGTNARPCASKRRRANRGSTPKATPPTRTNTGPRNNDSASEQRRREREEEKQRN